MAWWNRVAARFSSLRGRAYQSASTLYNLDVSRSAELLDFVLVHGTYIREQERDRDGLFVDRHAGALVGPFSSPKSAENFIVATPWFTARDDQTPLA